MYSTSLPDLPVAVKNAQGVVLGGNLYVGGGYTGDPKTDALVYVFDLASCAWTYLPVPCPSKWSGLGVYRERLVLVGGRLIQCQSTNFGSFTNKLSVWNERGGSGEGRWEPFLPSMSTARLSPIVISHHGCLVVAGGQKGLLDFHVEVLHADSDRWMSGPSLPLPCFAHTSTWVREEWYLMDQHNGVVQHANINTYIVMATGKHALDRTRAENEESNNSADHVKEKPKFESGMASSPRRSLGDVNKNKPVLKNGVTAATNAPLPLNDMMSCTLWKKLPTIPPPFIPFRIASTNSHLLALSVSNPNSSITISHAYLDGRWMGIEGRFPATLGSGLLLGGGHDQDTLYILGGELSQHYTNSAHKSTLTSVEKLKMIKKSRQLRLFSD